MTLSWLPNEETAEKRTSCENQTPNHLFRQMGLSTKPPDVVQHYMDMLNMEEFIFKSGWICWLCIDCILLSIVSFVDPCGFCVFLV
jgi:hypothetical protein